ncbi:MAG TPA: hypothetical protein VEN47_04300 [Myxococcota bacterium]|nr:hypothetical protein [Myxococcota bacterium]
MTREEQLEVVQGICQGESFAVFAFAGEGPGDPPYSSVMFFAQTPELGLIFATNPKSTKGQHLRPGNGACAQIDTRGVGLVNMAQFARVTVQGRVRPAAPAEREALLAIYRAKLPNAKVFLELPGVELYRLDPSRAVCARGLFERFELEF